MTSKRTNIILLMAILLIISLACSLTGGGETKPEAPPEKADEDTIATSVAATVSASGESSDATDPPPTTDPAVIAESPPLPEPNFDYAGVSFYFNHLLAENLTAGVTPGNYDENSPWWSTPDHREYHFNSWVLSDAFHTPAIRIYPVADFRAINENVSEGLDELLIILESKPPDGTGLRVPDLFNAGQLFQAQVKYLEFQNGYGARWLSQYGQAFFPIGWPNLFYTFQGFTNDGAYYISIILPVNHPALPHPDSVTLDDAFYDNHDAYVAGIRSQLEAEGDASFIPSLILLDQIVETMLVGNP